MRLSSKYQTISTTSHLVGELLPGLSEEDRRRSYFYTLFPSLFIAPHPDYVLTHRIERLQPGLTRITCDWMFPTHVAQRPNFDAAPAVEFWDRVNRQDWEVCEWTQSGVRSRSYRPGPYSNLESMLAAFDRYYQSVMTERPR